MKAIIAAVVVLILASILLGSCDYPYWTAKTRTIDITDKARITSGSNGNTSGKYLIYSKEGTFEDTDSMMRLKFNSSDVYGQIQVGKRYRCLTYGWRLPFFSNYPNIVKCSHG